MIAEAVKVVKQSDSSSWKRGLAAHFVNLGDGWGLKFYWDKKTRDTTFYRQKIAAKEGLAPKLGRKITFKLNGCKRFGYLTETVSIVKQIFATENKVSYDDANDTEGAWEYRHAMKQRPEYIELMEKLENIGLETFDMHWANVGYTTDGRMLAIDFDQ